MVTTEAHSVQYSTEPYSVPSFWNGTGYGTRDIRWRRPCGTVPPGGAMFKPRKGKSLISWDEITHHVDNLEAYWHKDKAVGTCPVCLLQVAAPGMTHFYRHLLTHLPKHCLPHKCPLDCGFMATQWEQCRSHVENKHKLPWNDGMKQLSVHEANRARWDALTKRS
ncbi:hypothetical protein AAVH_15531 [Aphelenchoides avenae]|nr:hypothetical protein AAVH_15531 [Aphelenchus avenae]